jgi:sigma-E factor negative regulatory protein RseC
MENKLLHGTVTAVQNGILSVLINDENACEGCPARNSCSCTGAQEKRLQIPYTSGNYKEGDAINLLAKTSMGARAACFAFIFPLTLALAVLFAVSSAGKGEEYMALAALLVISVYYISLYFFKDKLKQKFTFIIQ